MFDGKMFLPETGMPIRKIACINSPLAEAEPVPFTVAILSAKSFTPDGEGDGEGVERLAVAAVEVGAAPFLPFVASRDAPVLPDFLDAPETLRFMGELPRAAPAAVPDRRTTASIRTCACPTLPSGSAPRTIRSVDNNP